jgi:hypothetical protein
MASKTFGGALSIYSGSYQLIGGLIDCTFPALEADSPVDTSSHDMTSGVRVNIPVGTFKWPDLTFQCNDLLADAGQVAVLASLGASSKFKFVSASGRTSYVNATVIKWAPDAQPINGKATMSGQATPSGVAPVS